MCRVHWEVEPQLIYSNRLGLIRPLLKAFRLYFSAAADKSTVTSPFGHRSVTPRWSATDWNQA